MAVEGSVTVARGDDVVTSSKKARALLLVSVLCALALVLGAAASARWIGTQVALASFTTDLADRSPAQRANIETAAARIDGRVVLPGETFSFNQAVGRRCLERGYEKAPGYAAGGVADTTGGGICQLSSTVYNAALLAGLRIVERVPHARGVRSVGLGRDAAVVYDRQDLRFTNPFAFAVRLCARATADRLVVEVVAPRSTHETVARHAEVEVRVETTRGPSGICARTWRSIGGRDELVSTDTYPALP